MRYFVLLNPDNTLNTLYALEDGDVEAFLASMPPVLEVTQEQAAAIKERPEGRWVLDGGWRFTPDFDFRQLRWMQIKQDRNAAENGGFVWDGAVFDSDPISQARIQGAVQLAMAAAANGQPFSVDWTLADNTVRTLNEQEMIAVGAALAAHVRACHELGRELRAQIEAAATPEDAAAITWPR